MATGEVLEGDEAGDFGIYNEPGVPSRGLCIDEPTSSPSSPFHPADEWDKLFPYDDRKTGQ